MQFKEDRESLPPGPITRREFVGGVVIAGTLAAEASLLTAAPAAAPTQKCTLIINGKTHDLTLEPRVTLLDALRDHLQITGTKKGCDHGQCGACTVLVDGRRINSCLSLAITNEGAQITTIEGLSSGNQLRPMQAAFLDHDGFQCGYCTPGQICSAVGLLAEAKAGGTKLDDDGIREGMSGNICRCGAYPNIVAAVRAVEQGGTA